MAGFTHKKRQTKLDGHLETLADWPEENIGGEGGREALVGFQLCEVGPRDLKPKPQPELSNATHSYSLIHLNELSKTETCCSWENQSLPGALTKDKSNGSIPLR